MYLIIHNTYILNIRVTQPLIKTVKKVQFYPLSILFFIQGPQAWEVKDIHLSAEQTEKKIIKILKIVMIALMTELFCNILERFKTWWQTFSQITGFNGKIIKIKSVRLPSTINLICD